MEVTEADIPRRTPGVRPRCSATPQSPLRQGHRPRLEFLSLFVAEVSQSFVLPLAPGRFARPHRLLSQLIVRREVVASDLLTGRAVRRASRS
jgi:hypothetical protein